jgi:hypothetical protein
MKSVCWLPEAAVDDAGANVVAVAGTSGDDPIAETLPLMTVPKVKHLRSA